MRQKALRRKAFGALLLSNYGYEKVEASTKIPIKEDSMAKASSGVYQLPNGTWGFGYAFWIDGKQKDIKRTTDENGIPFKTERAAMRERESGSSFRFLHVPVLL